MALVITLLDEANPRSEEVVIVLPDGREVVVALKGTPRTGRASVAFVADPDIAIFRRRISEKETKQK